MALAALTQYLRELHQIIPKDYRHSDALAVIQDLKRVVLNEIPIEEQGMLAVPSPPSDLAFPPRLCILTFLE